MPNARLYLQPSMQQLLAADALSEAQVLTNGVPLDRPVTQVVFGFPSAREGSLVVARAENLASQEGNPVLKEVAAVVIIKAASAPHTATSVSGMSASGALAAAQVDLELDKMVRLFSDLRVPLILVPGLGEPVQVAEDIRLAFQAELKRCGAKLHAHFVATVIENGLTGLAEELSELIARPVAIETADFKVLASQNMGATPVGQQKTITEEVVEELNRELRSVVHDTSTIVPDPVRIGRRLVTPIVLEGVVVGFVSVMVRPSDDVQSIGEYLAPATLAALVDFSHRRKEVSTFTVTQRSLLKDLLSGRNLSAADQERLEQHFGFDLCDGFFVLVVQLVPGQPARDANWPSHDGVAMVEMEVARVFVLPFDSKAPKTWQQHAEELSRQIKQDNQSLKIQLGASRMTTNLLDLPDAYREARQSVIIGLMSGEDKEFSVGYTELGVKRLLYLMIDHPELDRFYEENLAPLEAYDTEWETELTPTLRVYLEQSFNLNSAAKELFVHRHTMRYRLEQIAELLNVDIDSTEVLLNLQIAFLIRDMKGKPKA